MKDRSFGRTRELVLFSFFAALMLISAKIDVIMNVHQLSLLISVLTVIYRTKALVPIYTYIMLEGLLSGFSLWWVPYLYLWFVLWGAVMLIPKGLPASLFAVLVTVISGLHGLGFGLLYAPYHCAVLLKGDFSQLWLWVAYGFSADVVHMIGNVCASLLAVPTIAVICRIDKRPLPFKMIKKKAVE